MKRRIYFLDEKILEFLCLVFVFSEKRGPDFICL